MLIIIWLLFRHCHDLVRAKNMKIAIKKTYHKTLAIEWLKICLKKESLKDEINALDSHNYEKTLMYLLWESLKLHELLFRVLEKMFELNKKLIVWVQIFAQQVYVTCTLILAKIDAKILATYINSEECAEMIWEFNTNSNKTMILITLYALNSDFNLQSLC